MKRIIALLVILVVVALLILGCTKQSQYPAGYASYGQQGQNPQGYVGGGCSVAGSDNSMPLDVSEPIAAA
ncbi:hypothetical protein HYU50_04045 [Candidatus Woesearchaeota archaeon]|nr:hypothetical protein [Candidatus Woesearchaeota archaeon]